MSKKIATALLTSASCLFGAANEWSDNYQKFTPSQSSSFFTRPDQTNSQTSHPETAFFQNSHASNTTEPILSPIHPGELITTDIPYANRSTPWELAHLTNISSLWNEKLSLPKECYVEAGCNIICNLQSHFDGLLACNMFLQAFLLGDDYSLGELHLLAKIFPLAANLLGWIYANGIRVNQCQEKAINFFNEAITMSSSSVAYISLLALTNSRFINLDRNITNKIAVEVSNICERGGSNNPGFAFYQLGKFYETNEETMERADFYYLQSALCEYPEALMRAAIDYKSHQELTMAERFSLLEKAALKNNISAVSAILRIPEAPNQKYWKAIFLTHAKKLLLNTYNPLLYSLENYSSVVFPEINIHPWLCSLFELEYTNTEIDVNHDNGYTYVSCSKIDHDCYRGLWEENFKNIGVLERRDMGLFMLDNNTFPEKTNVKSIQPNALGSCQNLTTLKWPKSPYLASIGTGFLESNSSISTFSLPDLPSLLRIDSSFLLGASALREINLPEDLPRLSCIGNDFVRSAQNLLSIRLPQMPELRSIGHSFLSDTTNLREVIFPHVLEALVYIPNYLLSNTPSLREITMPSIPKLEKIGENFLYESGVEILDISRLPMTESGKPAFQAVDLCNRCTNIKSIILPLYAEKSAWRSLFNTSIPEDKFTYPM